MNCIRCKGNTSSRFSCGKPYCPILQKFKNSMPKVDLNFSGSSPPDLFVGKFNYPYVYTGILSPARHDEAADRLSSPESWFKERLPIEGILQNRGSMIYSRFTSNIKEKSNKLLGTMQEVSMASKPCDVEFFLARKPRISMELSGKTSPICNPAPLIKATLQENPSISRKVDYVVSDTDLVATEAITGLYRQDTSVTSMIKLMSAGLLGIKRQRKLVPSRWATTAVDDIISKSLLKGIKDSQWISDYQVHHDEYIGNHYEILLLPKQWSYEVIEAKMSGSLWNPSQNTFFMCDDEGYYGRKSYAENVSGAYYSCRLAVAEHLQKIKRQASVLIFREVRDEYYAPCGVGVLRETARAALNSKPDCFPTLDEAMRSMGPRLRIPISEFAKNSRMLRDFKQQKTLSEYK